MEEGAAGFWRIEAAVTALGGGGVSVDGSVGSSSGGGGSGSIREKFGAGANASSHVPITYARMPSIPAGATRMLWKELMGSDVSPEGVDWKEDKRCGGDVTFDRMEQIRRDPSMSEQDVIKIFDEIEMGTFNGLCETGGEVGSGNDLGDKSVAASVRALLQGRTSSMPDLFRNNGSSRQPHRKGSNEFIEILGHGEPDPTPMAHWEDVPYFDKKAEGRGLHDLRRQRLRQSIKNGDVPSGRKQQRNVDPFFLFIRDSLVDMNILKVTGRPDEEESSSGEESGGSPLGNNQKKTSGTSDNGVDFSGWKRKEEKQKRTKRNKTQYLQIQRDIQHQYGIILSRIPIEEGGFALGGVSDEDLNDDDNGTLQAMAREHDTMRRWNSMMVDACMKRQYRRKRPTQKERLLVSFPSQRVDNAQDGVAVPHRQGGANIDKLDDRRPHDPWLFKNIKQWPLDEATRYALRMVPGHLMRAGRVSETSALLCDRNFYLGRVLFMGAEKASLVHQRDVVEMDRRADEEYDDIGRDGDNFDARGAAAAVLHTMMTTLTESYASIAPSKKLGKNERVKGEKIRGETGRALHGVAWQMGQLRSFGNEAILCYHMALKYKTASLGQDHPSVAGTLHNMGNLHLDRSEYHDALACYESALKIERGFSGGLHKNVARTLKSLGMIYGMTSEFDKVSIACCSSLNLFVAIC